MISKAKLEKRILEEYENFVFQGYTRAEIAYMGTCLQRWAIEGRKGPANLNPIIDKIESEETLDKLIDATLLGFASLLDSQLYIPMKQELAGRGITHSLGIKKELFKDSVEVLLENLKKDLLRMKLKEGKA